MHPFFLLAGVFMVLALALWMWVFAGDGTAPPYYGLVGWHAHEMLFGYSVAVGAGFLLPAVRSWTGRAPVKRYGLVTLLLLWFAGRIMPWLDTHVSGELIAFTDLLFLPLLAIVVAAPIIRQRLKQYYIYIALPILMAVANILIHLQLLNLTLTSAQIGLDAMVSLIVLVIIVTSGRIIPFITKREIADAAVSTQRWVERMSIASFVLLALLELADFPAYFISITAAFATVIHLARMVGWFDTRMLVLPQVWVLHTAYAWIIVGFALKAFSANQYASHALHAYGAGGIGIMTLGLMCWAGLSKGAPSREVSPAIAFAFMLINIAVMVRVISPIVIVGVYIQLAIYAALLLAISFLPFLWIYWPVLFRSGSRSG